MAINNAYQFVMIFDVENGNPNGDPDAGNAPRIDSETNHGYITDVCLKRKIRNYVELVKEGEAGYNILIKPDRSLNSKFTEAYEAEGVPIAKGKASTDEMVQARDYMCRNYFDVRAFGAVMSTGDNPCGIVKGPVQLTFARSLSPITIQEVTITRQAKTTDDRQAAAGTSEMGRKSIIPYAAYRGEGYVSAVYANKITDLNDADIELLWQAIMNMFEEDRSAARGKMCMRKLYIFKHDNVLGCAPAHILFDKIQITANNSVPRKFADYDIVIDETMPAGVEFIEKI